MKKILSKFKDSKSKFLDQDMKFVVCAASLPKKIQGHNSLKFFESFLPDLKIVKNESFLKINPLIKHEVLDVDDLTFEQKCEYLLQIIMSSNVD